MAQDFGFEPINEFGFEPIKTKPPSVPTSTSPQEQSSLDWWIEQALRTLPAVGGGIAGGIVGGIPGGMAGGGAGAAAGNLAGNWYSGKEFNPAEFGVTTALGAVPPIFKPTELAGPGINELLKYAGKTALRGAGEGAVVGAAGTPFQHWAQTGSFDAPKEEYLQNAGAGGIMGGVLGGGMGAAHGYAAGHPTVEPRVEPPVQSQPTQQVQEPWIPFERRSITSEPTIETSDSGSQLGLQFPEEQLNLKFGAQRGPGGRFAPPIRQQGKPFLQEPIPRSFEFDDIPSKQPEQLNLGPVSESIAQPPRTEPPIITSTEKGLEPTRAGLIKQGQDIVLVANKLTKDGKETLKREGYIEVGRDGGNIIFRFFKDLVQNEEGSFDLEGLKTGLRKLLGREPTEEEVQRKAFEENSHISVEPGEQTGRVAEFPQKNRQLNDIVMNISEHLKQDANRLDEEGLDRLLQEGESNINAETDPEIIRDNFVNMIGHLNSVKLHGTPDEIEFIGQLRDTALDKFNQSRSPEDLQKIRDHAKKRLLGESTTEEKWVDAPHEFDPSLNAHNDFEEARSSKTFDQANDVVNFWKGMLERATNDQDVLHARRVLNVAQKQLDSLYSQELSHQLQLGDPTNDIQGIRPRNVLGSNPQAANDLLQLLGGQLGPRTVSPSDQSIQLQSGQQNLPLGPVSTRMQEMDPNFQPQESVVPSQQQGQQLDLLGDPRLEAGRLAIEKARKDVLSPYSFEAIQRLKNAQRGYETGDPTQQTLDMQLPIFNGTVDDMTRINMLERSQKGKRIKSEYDPEFETAGAQQIPLKLRSQKFWDEMTVKVPKGNIKEMGERIDPNDATNRSHRYAQSTLKNMGYGEPGLTVSDSWGSTLDDPNFVPNTTAKGNYIDITYRGPEGNAVANAHMTVWPDGRNEVSSFTYDKNAGLLGGRAAYKVAKKMFEYGTIGADGTYSKHVADFLKKMKTFLTEDEGGVPVEIFQNMINKAKQAANDYIPSESITGKPPIEPPIRPSIEPPPPSEPPIPPEYASTKNTGTKKTNYVKEVLNLTSGLPTTGDMSAPGRQGMPMIFTPEFWKAMVPMFKGGWSKENFDAINGGLAEKPLFQRPFDPETQKFGKSIGEQIGMKLMGQATSLGPHEESVASKWIETGGSIPGFSAAYRQTVGRYTSASNRAFITFLNHVRANRTEKLMDLARNMSHEALTTGSARPGFFKQKFTPDEAANLNPYENLVFGKEIADFVNTATGRAPLKMHLLPGAKYEVDLEPAANALSMVMFAPRLVSSRMRMMNPNTYIMASPFVRKQYLKAAVSMGAAWYTMGQLAKVYGSATGKDVTVSDDMDSADFGKIRIGNTRLDPGASFQQFLVAGHRLWSGQYTSSSTGQTHRYGEGFQAQTQLEAGERLFANKLNPATKFAYDLLNQSQYQPFHVYDRTAQMFVPLVLQDLKELYDEDPSLIPGMMPPVVFGMGTQTYSKGESVGKIVPPENDWLASGGGVRDIFGLGQ